MASQPGFCLSAWRRCFALFPSAFIYGPAHFLEVGQLLGRWFAVVKLQPQFFLKGLQRRQCDDQTPEVRLFCYRQTVWNWETCHFFTVAVSVGMTVMTVKLWVVHTKRQDWGNTAWEAAGALNWCRQAHQACMVTAWYSDEGPKMNIILQINNHIGEIG